MANFSFLQIAKELDNVEETGVSCAGQSNNWSSEEAVQPIVDEIINCKNLVYLNLEGNTLGVDAAKAIGKALEKHPEFKKALWKDLFTGRLKTEIPEALKVMGRGIIGASANLTVLDCSDNALGPNGMAGLVELLRSPACYSLQELKLNNCGLGIGGGKMLSEALLTCHKKSSEAGTPLSLKIFIAGRNRLENEGAKALAKVFLTVKTLEEIAMPQNGIYHDGITALSAGFKENENMKVLNLNDNTIRSKGASSLAEAFFSMQKLKDINFGDCLLKTKGALFLADSLQDAHNNLESINLGFNEIGPDGGLAVISAMQNKPNIKNVILGGNQFGYECRERIQEIANENEINASINLSEDESEGESDGEGSEIAAEDEDCEEDASTENNSDIEPGESDVEEEQQHDDVPTYLNKSQSLSSTVDDTITANVSSNSVLFAGEEERPNTIETFFDTPNPSLKMFNALCDSNKIDAFRTFLKQFKDDEYLIALIFTVLKCSAISIESDDALNVALALYQDAFDYAKETNQITRVRTFFLIQLGLLKCEDKSFKPSYNLKACRHAMKKAIENNSLPNDIQTTFNLFLEKMG